MITNPQELETTLSGPIPPGRLARAYGQDIARHGLWADAMRLAAAGTLKGPEAHLAFHAGWALEFAYFHDPAGFGPHVARFLEDFPKVQNPSVQRHYTKILCDLLRRGTVGFAPAGAGTAAKAGTIAGAGTTTKTGTVAGAGIAARSAAVALSPPEAEAIAERCFDLLIAPSVRVGVKVWAMDVLEMLAARVEWIGEHLPGVISQQMAGGSPGLVSHGRKLLRRLK